MSGESHATGPEIPFFVNIGKFEIPCFDEFQTDCYIWKVRIFTKLGIVNWSISKIQKLSILHDISIKVQVKNDHRSKFSLEKKKHGIRGGHGFESRWSPEFSGFFFPIACKLENLLRWSFFTFIYNRSSNMNISCILQSIKVHWNFLWQDP